MIARLQRRLRRVRDEQLVDAAWIVGIALIVIGCALIYGPSGFIVAGALLMRTAWQLGRPPSAELVATKAVERWYSTGDDVEVDEDEA